MVEIIKNLANDLSSRTILAILALGGIIVFPEFREFVVSIFDIFPEAIEDILQEGPVAELLLLVVAYFGRKNVRAKI